jgi:hypothetical protein
MEQIRRVGKLRTERGFQIVAYGVATLLYAGSYGRVDIFRPGAKLAAHDSDGFFNDALDRTAPAGMESSCDAVLRVGKKDGKTVGGQDSNHHARRVRDQPIAGERLRASGMHNVNHVGMNLTVHDQRPRFPARFGAKRAQETLSVFFYVPATVFFREAQVDRSALVAGAHAAWTHTESVDKPGQLA